MVLLFDNHIGRKRNVDGGVLAGLSFMLEPKRYLAVTFSDPDLVVVFARGCDWIWDSSREARGCASILVYKH